MRICLNLLAATAGGQLSRAQAFLERFHRFSGGAELVVLKDTSALIKCAAVNGHQVINVPIGSGRFKVIRRIAWENCIMPSVLRANNIDVFLTFSHYLPGTLPKSLPSVVGVSNLAPFSDNARDVESPLMRLRLNILRQSIMSSVLRAHKVIALSETCRDVLIGQGATPEKISVIPNGVDRFWSQKSKDSGTLLKHGITRPYLLYVSHFYRYKNHQRLLNAFAMLPASMRASYQLALVGKPYNQRYFEEVLSLRARSGLDCDVVMIAGESGEHLRHLYQQATLFVFPSLIENSPNILLEAMAGGAPIAASKLSPMPEFGGMAVEYFDPLDVHDMTQKIATLLNKQELMVAMKEKSTLQAQHFSWDNFVNAVLQQCQTVSKK